MDLEQIKRERDNALQQPMPRPEQEQAAGHDDDKNPELINSILKNYNGGGGGGDEQPQQPPQRQAATQQYEEGEMDLRDNVETLEENAEEFQVGGGAEVQYQYFNYMNEMKKVALIVVLVLLLNNPMIDKVIYRYVKKFIFTGESLNWIGYVVKALLIGLLFFTISHFLMSL